ncbi:putative S-adenosyl-L-methionine-dependent methyltransferase [Lyophyllum shimeji]|uniref:S-adenosyl-L-methionine-dependent methyltransferase n=1 Tax=Lyophyllum shimeji TaxID=47721 RepID=A0A9P3PSE0_LYOSH|nr:putative S-adenosyl-L-methionine-dependent methyltransferase [Lyophyllum shimeji]
MNATVNQHRSFHHEDAPYTLPNDAPEWKRLDDMHEGIDAYLGHRLSYAPVDQNVKRILEIGCGSGAWATQAARTYPDATVTAIDISEPPPRRLPENVVFQKVNVAETLPFEPESFDLIHARFVFVHLPDWEAILQRVITLLRSGGWLLIEDLNHVFLSDNDGIGPGIQKFQDVIREYNAHRNVDSFVGSKLERTLRNTSQFSEVNVVEVKCRFDGDSEDPNTSGIGQTMRESFRKAYQALDPKLGVTPEVQAEFYKEFDDPGRNIYLKIYMTWSRKK